jgi:hypothetical protein
MLWHKCNTLITQSHNFIIFCEIEINMFMFMWDNTICHKGKGVVESSRSWCVADEVKNSPPSNNIEFHDNIVLHQGDLCHIAYWWCDSQNLHVSYPMFVCYLWFTCNILCFNVPHLVLLVSFNVIWCFVSLNFFALCFMNCLMFQSINFNV